MQPHTYYADPEEASSHLGLHILRFGFTAHRSMPCGTTFWLMPTIPSV